MLHKERQAYIRKLIGLLRDKTPVMYYDEATTNLWDRPAKLWQRKGEKIWCPLPNRGSGISILGAMDANDGSFYFQILERPQKTDVIKFLQYVGKHMDHEMCHVVMDNAKTHKGEDFYEALENVNLQPFFLPSCSSILNPIETIWAM